MGIDSFTTISLFVFTTTIRVGFSYPSLKRGNGGSENYICGPESQTGEGWSWELVIELDGSYSCDCLSRALGDPAVVLSSKDSCLIGETGGDSLGGSVLQCSGSHQEHGQSRAHFSSPPHDLISPSAILNVILSEIHRGFLFAEPTAQFPIQPPNLPPARRKETALHTETIPLSRICSPNFFGLMTQERLHLESFPSKKS